MMISNLIACTHGNTVRLSLSQSCREKRPIKLSHKPTSHKKRSWAWMTKTRNPFSSMQRFKKCNKNAPGSAFHSGCPSFGCCISASLALSPWWPSWGSLVCQLTIPQTSIQPQSIAHLGPKSMAALEFQCTNKIALDQKILWPKTT